MRTDPQRQPPEPNLSDKALHEQQDWLRVTLSSIGDAVITADASGNVTFLNTVAQSLTGWSLDEASGAPLDAVFKIVNEETRQAVKNPATRALREGLVFGPANHTLIAKDGTERPIDDSAAQIRNGQGKLAGVVLIFRDITERRQAEQQGTGKTPTASGLVRPASIIIWSSRSPWNKSSKSYLYPRIDRTDFSK
jgi:PAS domain S-box-containing protein